MQRCFSYKREAVVLCFLFFLCLLCRSVVKMYRCRTCDAEFVDRADYITHLATHHILKHVCGQCGERFRFVRDLEGHFRELHSVAKVSVFSSSPIPVYRIACYFRPKCYQLDPFCRCPILQ